MRTFFLVIGLLLLLGSSLEGFIQPSGPTPTQMMAVVLLVGGFILLGIAQLLGALVESRPGPPIAMPEPAGD